MLFSRALLLSLLTALLFEYARSKRINCKDKCCEFVEGFPVRLKHLRSSYSQIQDYYEENDDLETALLNRTVLENVKSPYGCHVMKEILYFYLETVLPTAALEVKSLYKKPIDAIGNIFLELKRELAKCRNYFACEKPFEISTIKDSYNQMAGKGLYKAMGELDLLFNYIENYLASKRQKA
ncbi:interleukin-10 [Electrophorus electricus]|uniref:Interleukin family protein n=1 Tax=Electrophorus electricus TaxID=8005 RepID=A0A4W4GNF8_ELEEL|nr:interleukin-10 [Electrophorus electricus]